MDTRRDQEATRVHRGGGTGSQGAWGLRQVGRGAQRHLWSRRSPAGLTWGEAEGGRGRPGVLGQGSRSRRPGPWGLGIRVEALSHVGP